MYALILLFVALVSAYSSPGPCSGDCWTHDPGLYQRQSDGKYFRFATGNGINISTADSIKGPWTNTGYALPGGSNINHAGSKNLWAVDIHQQGNTYYMYYSVSQQGSKNSVIGVATSATMEAGNWTDHGTLFTSTNKNDYNAIDANWVKIGDTEYLNFGSYWHDLYQVELESSLKVADKTPYNIAYNATGSHRQEAAFQFQHGKYHYLLFSSGKGGGYEKTKPPPGEEYHIGVCRSESGTGHFVDKTGKSCVQSGGTTLLESHGNVYGPGGQGVVNDKDLGMVLYYHYADPSIGLSRDKYQFGWNQLKWTDDWPEI